MAVCNDPRLTYLNDVGYNVVRLPRRGIVPLGVIGRDNKARDWLGTLDQIWTTTAAVPVAGPPQPVSTLSGTRTSDIKLSLGLDILANALTGMFGATAPSLDLAYKDAKSLQFAFKDVRSVSIDPFQIGDFLSQGDLKPNPVVKRYFSGEKNVEALVVTEILEAKSIGVIAKKDAGTEVNVDLPQIKQVLGAKIGVTTGGASNTEVVFEGPEFLTFGFKAFGIGRVDGEWQIHGIAADGGHAFGRSADADAPKPVVDSGELVELTFS